MVLLTNKKKQIQIFILEFMLNHKNFQINMVIKKGHIYFIRKNTIGTAREN